MNKYLAIFVAPVEAYDNMKEVMKSQAPDEKQKGMEEWKMWMERHKANLVDPGSGVGSAKRVAQDGSITDARNTIGGYMIVQAESHAAAADLFKDVPHFGVEGATIDVMQIMQMEG